MPDRLRGVSGPPVPIDRNLTDSRVPGQVFQLTIQPPAPRRRESPLVIKDNDPANAFVRVERVTYFWIEDRVDREQATGL